MKKEEEIKTQEAEKDMEQSGDDVDLDDKILESSQRQPESAVANAAYDDVDNALDSVSPEKELDDHHSPRSDEAEPESNDEQQKALETIKEVTEECDSDEKKKAKKNKPKKAKEESEGEKPLPKKKRSKKQVQTS